MKQFSHKLSQHLINATQQSNKNNSNSRGTKGSFINKKLLFHH